MEAVVAGVAPPELQNISFEVTSVIGPLEEGTEMGPLLELAALMRGAVKVWPATSIWYTAP